MSALRVLSMLVVLGVFWFSLWLYLHPNPAPQTVDLIDLTTENINFYQYTRTDADQFFQLGVLILGGLWTVAVVGKDTKIRAGDRLEIASLIFTCLTFVLFFIGYQSYREAIGAMSLDFVHLKKLPDPSDPWFRKEISRVAIFFYLVVAASASTILSVSQFRRN